MPRAKNEQQKVLIFKEDDAGLCPSRSYYSMGYTVIPVSDVVAGPSRSSWCDAAGSKSLYDHFYDDISFLK